MTPPAFGLRKVVVDGFRSVKVESHVRRAMLSSRIACTLTLRADPMGHDTTDFAGDVRRQLHDDGYTVHLGETADGLELSGKHWFTWVKPGMSEAEVGPTCDTELGAWSSALAHRIANSEIALYFC